MSEIRKCCVNNCNSHNLNDISYHGFPANLSLNLKWKQTLINYTGKCSNYPHIQVGIGINIVALIYVWIFPI
jgi:hypothetical protein